MKSKPIHQILLDLDRRQSRQLKRLLTLGPFVEGSVISFKRRCGKEVCRCRKGGPHESLIISQLVKGKLKVVYTRPEDRRFLMACKERWREFKKNKKDLVDLHKKILIELDHLATLKTEAYRPKPAKG